MKDYKLDLTLKKYKEIMNLKEIDYGSLLIDLYNIDQFTSEQEITEMMNGLSWMLDDQYSFLDNSFIYNNIEYRYFKIKEWNFRIWIKIHTLLNNCSDLKWNEEGFQYTELNITKLFNSVEYFLNYIITSELKSNLEEVNKEYMNLLLELPAFYLINIFKRFLKDLSDYKQNFPYLFGILGSSEPNNFYHDFFRKFGWIYYGYQLASNDITKFNEVLGYDIMWCLSKLEMDTYYNSVSKEKSNK